MNLNAFCSKMAIVEHGGIARAVRATGMPRLILSRHLAQLEETLGTRLIERKSKRLRLTKAGQDLADLAKNPLGVIPDIEDRIRPSLGPLSGKLRLSVPFPFGHTHFARVIAEFASAHPTVFLNVVVDDRHVDLLRDGFDAAVRILPAPNSSLTGQLLTRSRLVLVAAPALAQRVGYTGEAPDEIVWPAIVRP